VNGIPVCLDTSRRFLGPSFHIAEKILIFMESRFFRIFCSMARYCSSNRTVSVLRVVKIDSVTPNHFDLTRDATVYGGGV
jgi:hypothetical protein